MKAVAEEGKEGMPIPSFLTPVTPCDYCEAEGAMLRCSQCHCFYYCNQECQKKHWNTHKADCKALHARFELSKKQQIDMDSYEQKYDEFSEQSCAICFEVIETPVQLPCHHIFCSACITQYQDVDMALKCPLCRSELDTNLFQFVYKNAASFMQRANGLPENSALYLHAVKIARKEFDRLKDIMGRSSHSIQSSLPIDASEAELLLLEKRYEEAITFASEALIKHQEELQHHQIRIKAYLYLVQAEAYEGLEKYNDAIKLIIKQFIEPLDYQLHDQLRIEYRNALNLLVRCCYKAGKYPQAIDSGYWAISMNRSYEGVHEYVAWSFQALGKWDEAVAVLRKAVRYVAPWDPAQTARYQQLLEDMLKAYHEIETQRDEGEHGVGKDSEDV